MRIESLGAHPRHLPALAAAHVQAFGALEPGWNVAAAAAELRSHAHAEAIPCTWLALAGDGDWLGSVSLLDQDHPQLDQYRPWLASLYVRPPARGGGVGEALLAHAIARARAWGLPRLYLYCSGSVGDWYRRLGWRDHDLLVLGPLHLQVLALDLVAPAD